MNAIFLLLAASFYLGVAVWSYGNGDYGYAGLWAGLTLLMVGLFFDDLWQGKK